MASPSDSFTGPRRSIPWVANAASNALKNTNLDQAAIDRAAESAVEGAKPLSNNRYKVQMVKTAVKRALAAAQA